MANNRLILRKMISPWVTQHMDITRSTTLTHVELDSNFVYLKGEVITSASVDGNTLTLNKINGNTIEVDIEGLSGDTGQTLNLINQLRGDLDENALWEPMSTDSKSIKLKNSNTIGATVYTPNLNIKVQPSRDNAVTQVLVRDSEGYIKYKDVSSFTDLSVVSGDYNVQTGVVTLTNNDGNSFDISGFSKNITDSYTTNAYIEDGVMYFDNNVHGPKYYQVNVNELINVIIDRGDCSEEQYSQYLKLANEYESINDKKIKHEDELVELEGDVSELYKLIDTLKIQLDSLDPEQDADQMAKLVAQLKIYKNSVEEKLKLITVSKDKIKLLSSNSILEFATYMPINESNFNCWARTQIINIIGYEDRGPCSDEKYSEYIKLANHYSLTKQEFDLLVISDSELTIQITQIENNISEIINQISNIEKAIENTDDQELIAQLTKQLNAYKIQLENFTAQLNKLQKESLSVKDVLEKIEKSKVLDFGAYMPVNEVNFDCWSEQLIIDAVGYEDRGACSEDDYNTYVKIGQKVLTENENIQTLQLELSENERILKTYKDRIAELEAMPQPLPDDLQKELNVLIEDGYSLEAEIKRASEIINNWLESDDSDFITQYMPINEVNFICWKHSQLLSIIEECCKDDVRGDCSDDKYSQYLKLANEYSTTKDLFDTTTETQTQLTILINEGVTTISEKEAQLLKLKKQLEDLLNSGGNPDLPFDVNLAISNIDELLVINTEYNINLGLWNNGIGSTEEDFNNRKSALLDSLNKILEKSYELETLLHLTFGSPSYGTEYGIKEELKLHLRDIKGNTDASGSGTGILQAAIATINAQTWTGDYSSLGDWMSDIINPLIVQSISSTSSIQSHLTNIKNKINAANANPGNGDNDELVAALQKQIASLTKELEDLTKVLDANKKQLLVVEEQLINITNSGVLQFEAYMPINEVNFDCWSEQLIIDAVGYEDRGACSLKSYTEYTAEADNYKKIKKRYDELIKEQSELMTQVVQFKTDIADLKANISSLENLISNLDPDTDSEEIAQLTKQLNAYKIQLENFTAQLSQIEADLSKTNERIQIILDSGELGFVAYMPVNEVNFDCWSETKLYNELNVKIESITNTVGYDERGDCSDDKYQQYLKLANQYDSVKKSYDDSKATEQQLSDDIINLEELIATSEKSVSNKNHVKNTLEGTKVDLEAEKARLQQILEDLLNAPGEDLFDVAEANKFSKVLIAQITQMGGVISQKTEQQTDVEFFTQYKESLQASVGDIMETHNTLMKMMISEVTEDYVGKNGIETILNSISSELSKITQILGSDFSNDAYLRLVAHHKYLVELASMLQEEIGSVEFPPSDNSEAIAELEEQIKTITTQITTITEEIATITEEITILDNEISGYKGQLQTYKLDYSTAQENIRVIEESSILQFEVYMPINEVNFDCWSEQLIIDAVGYEDRGECSLKSYTEYTAESKNYEANKEQYDILIKIQSELMTQVTQFKTNIADLMAARASKQTELDKLKSEDPNSPLIPVLEEEIKQLDRDIEDFRAQLSQIEADLSRTNERIQIIIDSGDLDFVAYMPVNEVNFDCWTETKLYNELNIKIESISAAVGYDERGKCSSDKYAVYLEEVAKYESNKSDYDSNIEERDNLKVVIDELESDIDVLKTEINDLNRIIIIGKLNGEDQSDNESLKSNKESELSYKETNLLQNKEQYSLAIEQIKVIEDSGDLEFVAYMPANEINFDCWTEQQIIDAVGYEDRGDCSEALYEEYVTYCKTLEDSKEVYDRLLEQKTTATNERTVEKDDYIKEKAIIEGNISFYQAELDKINQTIVNEDRDATSEELGKIAILELLINDLQTELNALIISEEASQEAFKRLIEDLQKEMDKWLISNEAIDYVKYLPVNEVNFDCWTETKLYNELNVKIESITNTVGYDERGSCSSDKYAVYLEEVAKYESKKSDYDSNIEERDSVKINIDELESDIDTLETELVILNNDRLYKVSIGESIEELQKTISDKESELSDKETDLTILRDRYSLAIEEIKVIEDSSDLEFVAYMPANEINFDCWTEQQIIDAVGYEDRGDCSEALYEEYVNIIKTSNDFYNKSLVPPSSWDALDLPDSISYKDLSLYMNKSVEFRDNQVIEFNQTLALYDSELTKYQAILDPLKVIENPTEEQLAEINGLEKIIKLLNANREKLISDNNADEKLYIELTKWFSDNIDYWNNSEYKVILETYGPANEVNFICYVNNLQNDKIDKLIKDNEYKIYNIESQLNDSSLDNEGTFNYYPNVYDDFSGNPKFSVGTFDEFDSIINLSSNDLVTWGKLVCNGGVGGAIIKNLITSIRCIESLENEISSIEGEESNDFDNLRNIYETEIQNLRSQQQSDPRLTTDLLEVKLSNMITERSVNSDLYVYMVDKLREVLKIYKQVQVIADDFCDNGGA